MHNLLATDIKKINKFEFKKNSPVKLFVVTNTSGRVTFLFGESDFVPLRGDVF